MANRSLADFGRTTAHAGGGVLRQDDEEGPDLDRSAFHDDASFEALLAELAAGGAPPLVDLPKTGEVIAGKYCVEEKLGQGGMGVVYRATHLISGKQVALKWMLGTCSDARARSRFVREARAAARIDHRNVVDIYDIGQDGDRGLYMVMQLLRGESLAQRLARGRLPIEEAVDVLLPAMRGVAAVHAAGVIHRDLKPDNIFLCETHATGATEAKVLDFGVSAVTAREDGDQTLTRDGALVGTLAYMSPEQIQDSREVDVRTDVYAFGVILYEALTGVQPFRADNQNGLVLAIIAGHAADPRTLRPELPDRLAEVVLRALSRGRAERFDDVESMLEALRAPGLYDMPAPRPAPPRPAARPRIAWALATVVAASLGATWWQSAHAPRQAMVTEPRSGALVARPADVPARANSEPAAPPPSSSQPAPEPLADAPAHAQAATATASPSVVRRASLRRASKLSRRAFLPAPAGELGTGAVTPAKVTARSGRIALEEL